MLTARGSWILFVSLVLLFFGLVVGSWGLLLVALTLLLWFGAEWLMFALRVPLGVRRLRVKREVADERGPVATLWAGRTFEVRLVLEGGGPLWLPHVAVSDLPPFAVRHVAGGLGADGPVGRGDSLEVRYTIRCCGPGLARFEGARVQLADLHGFFYHVAFVPGVVIYRVLPVLVEGGQPTPSLKRDNQLPPPGIHRLRRPGSASELLDLRDYLPGDPPKTIAWKVSARRDRLITKEFESEAPLRCTLFLDASQSVRVPSVHGKMLARLIEISAAALQANADVRDLTGLCIFDEHSATTTRPDRSPAHVTQLLQSLADVAALAPASARTDPHHLIPVAYAFAREVYPQLMRDGVNGLPFLQEWWESPASYTRLRRSVLYSLFRHKRKTWYLATSLILPPLMLVGDLLLLVVNHFWFQMAFWQLILTLILFDIGTFLFPVAVFLAATDRYRKLARYRKQLAALFSLRYGPTPGGLSALLEDDDAFSLMAERFLGEHHVPYTLPLYDHDGRYLFAAPSKVAVLAKALLAAVGRGRDNELFVLMADLLELDDALDPLLKAVRVARSRHHQVLVVVPWPDGMRLPSAESPDEDWKGTPGAVLGRSALRRFHQAYHRVRRAFTRMGVQVVCAASDEPVPLILERLKRLRAVGSRR